MAQAKAVLKFNPRVRWVFSGVQVGLLLAFVVVMVVLQGRAAAFSAFLGGFVCILPSFLYIRRVLMVTGAQNAKQICRQFYLGETIKIVLTIALSLLVFRWQGLLPLPYFLGFLVAQSVFLITPWIITSQL